MIAYSKTNSIQITCALAKKLNYGILFSGVFIYVYIETNL